MDWSNTTFPTNLTTESVDELSLTSLGVFAQAYTGPHGVISLCVCLIGLVFNSMNIAVLVHPKMRNQVNLLLTMLGVCQLLLQLIYIPYIILFNVRREADLGVLYTYSPHHARYLLFFADTAVWLHMTAAWLIICTACFRFIFVQFAIHSARLCSYRRAVLAGCLTIAASALVCVPNSVVNSVIEVRLCGGPVKCLSYTVGPNQHHTTLITFNFWLFAVMGKFIPSILLILFTAFLIRILREATERRKRLHTEGASENKTSNEHIQTTRMLLAVVVLFLCIEMPHGILVIYVAVTRMFAVYEYLGELIDLITLLAFTVNVILYSIMSRAYRQLFHQLFIQKAVKITSRKLQSVARYSGYERSPIGDEPRPSVALNTIPESQTFVSQLGSNDSDFPSGHIAHS